MTISITTNIQYMLAHFSLIQIKCNMAGHVKMVVMLPQATFMVKCCPQLDDILYLDWTLKNACNLTYL